MWANKLFLTSYSWESLRLSFAFSSSMCSASSLMGMGGWLIIPARQRGSEVRRTLTEWLKLLRADITHMQRCEDNYTITEHHISLRNTLRQKINFDPCVRTKWGESCLFANCFSLINCFLCDQRSNDSEKTNTDRTLIRRVERTHARAHTHTNRH